MGFGGRGNSVFLLLFLKQCSCEIQEFKRKNCCLKVQCFLIFIYLLQIVRIMGEKLMTSLASNQ